MATEFQRLPAEQLYQEEIDALIANEKDPVPTGWKMSPKSVLKYIVGGKAGKKVITPKYIGNDRLVEICIATLVTDRALLLIGDPGTAKSWLSEHLCAAINGDSTKVIQGTAGTTEEQINYSWNYAMLISQGPSEQALIKSPVYRAMESGTIARLEEISRCASEVQDALISILSEKRISVPELSNELPAKKGFSVIATANTRDKGVNEMSAALRRRFNIVVLPAPSDMQTEIEIVKTRVEQLAGSLDIQAELPSDKVIENIITIFRELRDGQTLDGTQKLKQTSGVLSTAEAISLLAIVKDEAKDADIWKEYLENVMKGRGEEYRGLYKKCKELNA